MQIAICDDIKECRETLYVYSKEFFAQKYIETEIYNFASGEELMANSHTQFDIILLDIELGDSNGIRLAKEILRTHKNTVIIIVTSYNHYLDDAMDLHVLRFLTKPITQERVFSALSRALAEMEEQIIYIPLLNNTILQLHVNEIVYLEAHLKRVLIYTTKGMYETRKPLKEIRTLLPSGAFGIPHASFIVNLHFIREFSRCELMLANPYEAVRIPITNRKQASFKRKFLDFIGEDH